MYTALLTYLCGVQTFFVAGDEYDRASANNMAYILERRSWMRDRLDAAARPGTLAYTI